MLLVVRAGAGAVDDVLDAENKRLAENLATKVSRLKSVSDGEHSAGDQLIPAQACIINALTLFNPVLMLKMTFVFCLPTCQLAYEIDREAEDQNDYLDGMVRNCHTFTSRLTVVQLRWFSSLLSHCKHQNRLMLHAFLFLVFSSSAAASSPIRTRTS